METVVQVFLIFAFGYVLVVLQQPPSESSATLLAEIAFQDAEIKRLERLVHPILKSTVIQVETETRWAHLVGSRCQEDANAAVAQVADLKSRIRESITLLENKTNHIKEIAGLYWEVKDESVALEKTVKKMTEVQEQMKKEHSAELDSLEEQMVIRIKEQDEKRMLCHAQEKKRLKEKCKSLWEKLAVAEEAVAQSKAAQKRLRDQHGAEVRELVDQIQVAERIRERLAGECVLREAEKKAADQLRVDHQAEIRDLKRRLLASLREREDLLEKTQLLEKVSTAVANKVEQALLKAQQQGKFKTETITTDSEWLCSTGRKKREWESSNRVDFDLDLEIDLANDSSPEPTEYLDAAASSSFETSASLDDPFSIISSYNKQPPPCAVNVPVSPGPVTFQTQSPTLPFASNAAQVESMAETELMPGNWLS